MHLVSLLLMDHIPVLGSLPLAVWRPSWERVTCSLPAWQSASPSPPVASTCWPLTANRSDWKQLTLKAAFLCVFPQNLWSLFGRFVLDHQRFDWVRDASHCWRSAVARGMFGIQSALSLYSLLKQRKPEDVSAWGISCGFKDYTDLLFKDQL